MLDTITKHSITNTMENRMRKNYSGDKFSFPIISVQDLDPDEFEFECVTKPCSPNSPADHLFFNGKLLPHVFPLNQPANNFSYSRSSSRSISSKDSLMSSRSNSTNSRSSNCSSARTSTSEASERKFLDYGGKNPGKKRVLNPKYYYSSSQRWQFISPAPVLMHQGSRSRSVLKVECKELKSRKMDNNNNDHHDHDHDHGKSWFGKKVLRSFVSACKNCHAIETST